MKMQETFKSTLDLIPNGVIIMDMESNRLSFANKEIHTIVGAQSQDSEYTDLEMRLTDFKLRDESNIGLEPEKTDSLKQIPSVQSVSSNSKSQTEAPEDMGAYLKSMRRLVRERELRGTNHIDHVFKGNKRYIQTRTSLINNGTHVIAIATDITRLKACEKQGKKLRSMFFSSVAHELRTPLNSIIPILKMVLENIDRLAGNNP